MELIIEHMKNLATQPNNEIASEVFDFLINQNFINFVNRTYISGGSSVLKGKKPIQITLNSCQNLIDSLKGDGLNINTNQRFLSIVGMSGSGKSEARKNIQQTTQYFPLDERLKIFLGDTKISNLSVFQTDGKFDAKKFEYTMYCAAYLSGKYNDYIIDHSGGSPLQPGLQALTEKLGGNTNFAIHLNVDGELIAHNIMHTVMYDNEKSVKEPVRDAVGIKLKLVKKGYEKEDPARKSLVAFETNSEHILCQLRQKYKNFCDYNKRLKTTTEKLKEFEKTLENEEEKKIFSIHLEESLKYVNENNWRRIQFTDFSPKTIVCSDVGSTARKMNEFLQNRDRFWAFIEGIPSRIPQYTNLSALDEENDVYLFDMHGVIHSGDPIKTKVSEFLKSLREKGKKVIIASNDTNSGEEYISTIQQKGLVQGIHFDLAITSGDVLSDMLERREIQKQVNEMRIRDGKGEIKDRKIKVFVLDDLNNLEIFKNGNENIFERVENFREADTIITGSPRYDGKRILVANKQKYLEGRQEILDFAVSNKLPIIVPNPDRKTPFANYEGNTNCQTLGAGRFAKLCQQKGNNNIIMTGKPSKYFYDFVKQKMSKYDIKINPERTIMIGDSFATDIIGGNDAEFKTCAVVNDKSNIGITIGIKQESFVKKIQKYQKVTPNVIIQQII